MKTPETTRKAVIYARLSRSSDSSSSIEIQIELLQKLAKAQGYDVVRVITDPDFPSMSYPVGFKDVAKHDLGWQNFFDGQQGAKPYRPGLGDLFGMLDKIQYILVTNTDRLWRSAPGSSLHIWAASYLARHGVTVHSLQDGLVQDDFATSLNETIKSMVKGEDVQKKRERIQKTMKINRDQGNHFVRAHQYGFKSAKGEVIPIEEELAIVKRIYSEFLAGGNFSGIAQGLNRDNIPTKEASRTGWKHRNVQRILAHPCYCGKARNSSGDVIDSPDYGPHEVGSAVVNHAVIGYSDWLKVQGMQKPPANGKGHRTSPERPLSGLVKCHCGLAMYSMTTKSKWFPGKTTARYVCRGGGKMHNLIRVDGSWKGRYSGLMDVMMPLTAEPLLRRMLDAASDSTLVTERNALQMANIEIAAHVDKTARRNRDGLIDDDTADQLLKEDKERRQANERQIAALNKRIAEADTKGINLAAVASALLGNQHPHVAKELLAAAVRSVTAYGDRITIKMAADGKEWSLPRYRKGATNGLPRVTVGILGEKQGRVTKDSRILVTYWADDGNPEPKVQDVTDDASLKELLAGVKSGESAKYVADEGEAEELDTEAEDLAAKVLYQSDILTIRFADGVSPAAKAG